MLFFPVGETSMTISILFPQALQSLLALLVSERAATFVLDFAFPDMVTTSFHHSVFRAVYPTILHTELNSFRLFLPRAGRCTDGANTQTPADVAMRNPSSLCYLFLLWVSRGQPCSQIAGEL